MRIVVLFNSLSGRGRAAQAALGIEHALAGAGYEPERVEAGSTLRGADLAQLLRDAGGADAALVVVGGDGTVQSTAQAARAAGTPIYHYPMGTENLFARNFGMRRDVGHLLEAVTRHQTRRAAGEAAWSVDVGVCNERDFLIMASVGFDANVVHRLARARKGRISHMSYVRHIAAECIAPSAAAMTVRMDGKEVVSGRKGLAVVANSKHYAMRANPAFDAELTDGLLDLCFMPTRHPLTGMLWLQRAKWGLHKRSHGVVHARGARVEIETIDRAAPFQLDGEAPGPLTNGAAHAAATTPMTMSVQAGVLPVLVPPL
ncbi:MAG: NAD(+)/NADH kinase [Caldilineaceae bacterium]|nr:NAD(+)/NADH kinase [Phycisphaerales bacterium]MCB0058806.1 NAD(+)/NADH kinase [Caldilineaceae bacterium]